MYKIGMRAAILLIALLAPASAFAASPPAVKGQWIDWSELNRRAASAQTPAPAQGEDQARALGDRVGQMVAAGDCRGGEKMALAAGDTKLAQAVRNYCLR